MVILANKNSTVKGMIGSNIKSCVGERGRRELRGTSGQMLRMLWSLRKLHDYMILREVLCRERCLIFKVEVMP